MNSANTPPLSRIGDEFVPETLMVPLSMVVRDELGRGSSQVLLTKRNHPVETSLVSRQTANGVPPRAH